MFDQIRPFNDNEVSSIVGELVNDKMFQGVLFKLLGSEKAVKQHLELIAGLNSIDDVQMKVAYQLLKMIEANSTDGISYSTMDLFDRNKSYIYISNHRDIILDSAFLNVILTRNSFRKTEIAIGDNLLIYPWIEKLVKLNRAFIVKRGLGIKEQLTASKELSAYIRHTITEKNESIWIAQREGRTKNGDDKTQAALLKMFQMSGTRNLIDSMGELNIVPMAISYEIEPCGKSKVAELLKRKNNPGFTKSSADDLNSMAQGLMNPKGRVHFSFGNPINTKLADLTNDKKNNEAINAIASYIDKRIHTNYKKWPNNYIAYDLLNKKNQYSERYTSEEKLMFIERMNKDISTMDIQDSEAKKLYLEMYANPVINFKHYS